MADNSHKNLNNPSLFSSKFFPVFLTLVLMIFLFGSSFFIAYQTGKPGETRKDVVKECLVGGCNSEICAEVSEEPKASICIYSPKFECYKSATCERQVDGECGWAQTPELIKCLADHQNNEGSNPESEFCGGIAAIDCPDGYTCKLDGNYPDAGGKCIKN